MPPSLTIVGSGIQSGRDLTRAAEEHIRNADKVLYLSTERITVTWLLEVNATSEPLHVFYDIDKSRRTTYSEMVEHILSFLRDGLSVCVVSYGHPGIFAYPMHEAVRRARLEQYPAIMLPGVSSLDWLYADLGLDPATNGCQVFDATDFLVHRRQHDMTSALVLLQVGLIAEANLPRECNVKGFAVLAEYLGNEYGPDYEVLVYEAAQYSIVDPLVQRMPLKAPSSVTLSLASTMYVPPKGKPTRDEDMIARLSAR